MSDNTADEIRAAQAARKEAKRAAQQTQRADDQLSLTKGVSMDLDVYEAGKGSRFANHDLSISAGGGGDVDDDVDDDGNQKSVRLLDSCKCSTTGQHNMPNI